MKSNLTFSLDHDLKVRFLKFCHESEQKQSNVIEGLIEKHMRKINRPQPASNETGNATTKETV